MGELMKPLQRGVWMRVLIAVYGCINDAYIFKRFGSEIYFPIKLNSSRPSTIRGDSNFGLSFPHEIWSEKPAAFAMVDEFDEAKVIFRWNERFFGLLGVWPLRPAYVKSIMWILYYIVHIILELADLFYVLGNSELVVQNLSESLLQILICVKLIVIRSSRKIGTLIMRVTDSIDGQLFENSEEKEIYLAYNRIAKTFFKVSITLGLTSSLFYYMKPMKLRIQGALQNESVPYVLACRIHLFFEMNDTTTYYLVWLYQAPVSYMAVWHTAGIGLLFALVLHVCGQLLAKDINDVFGLILLEELLLSTVLVGLASYAVLVYVDLGDTAQVFSFVLYGGTMLLLVYGYCAAGEYLITESRNLYSAYYQCLWYDMPESFKKQMLICMIGANKPIHLTAGGFYIFSLVSFMGTVKTAAGYISMLRTVI